MNHDTSISPKRQRLLLAAVVSGLLLAMLDQTIVGTALPAIVRDLHGWSSYLWVVTAYLVPATVSLPVYARLSDRHGRRALLLIGMALFLLGSALSASAQDMTQLIAWRGLQGLGAGALEGLSFILVADLFGGRRSAALQGMLAGLMGLSFIAGPMVGGFLADQAGWRWVFLVNLPIGIAVVVLSLRLLPGGAGRGTGNLDVAGAVTVTTSLMLAVYGVVNAQQKGWTSAHTFGFVGAAVVIFALFLLIESKVSAPLMPLRFFRLHNLAVANSVGILWAAAMFAWFFLASLYLQLVLHYSALQIGLSFLPANLIMAVFSLGLSAKLVLRFGFRKPLGAGLLLAAAGMALFVRAPIDGNFVVDVLPSMILLGFGAGMAFNPVLLGAMSEVEPQESGLASGIVNTAFMMGGALGLAVLASIAASRTQSLSDSGTSQAHALLGGYHVAFLLGAIFAFVAAGIGAFLLREREVAPHAAPVPEAA
jgi:EmrB/QacA subfamily drug resistance transporter